MIVAKAFDIYQALSLGCTFLTPSAVLSAATEGRHVVLILQARELMLTLTLAVHTGLYGQQVRGDQIQADVCPTPQFTF